MNGGPNILGEPIGSLVQVEKTLPLENIQDVMF